jgi:probable HAF family extracellular repeat protein
VLCLLFSLISTITARLWETVNYALLGALSPASFIAAAVNYPGTLSTAATGINDNGQVVGYYLGPSGKTNGFLYSGGTFTSIDYPGFPNTFLEGINNSGQIVGSAAPEPRALPVLAACLLGLFARGW